MEKNNDGASFSSQKKYLIPFALVTSLFFLWGLASSLNGTLIKHFQTALQLSPAQAGFVDSAFYIGYFVMAIPAGFILNRVGYKRGIILGLLLYSVGAILFYPAAELRVYSLFLGALFVIACGLAFLETAANPYVTVLGDPAGAEKRINFAQSFNGLSIIFGPIIGGLFIFSSTDHTNASLSAMNPEQAELIRTAEAHSVQTPYLVLAGVVLLIAFLFSLVRMPQLASDSESRATMKGILRHRHLIFGVIAQFFYVGAQASLWGYFVDLKLSLAHDDNLAVVTTLYRLTENMSATQIASFHASFGFILFMIGRFAGTWLLTMFKPQNLLSLYAFICLVLIGFAWFSSGLPAVMAILLTYFFMSIMFPTIFALSIKNLGNQLKLGSSLVIMAIVGGAVMAPLAGWASQSGMQNALIVPWFGFLFVLYFGLKGHQVRIVDVK